MMENTQWKWCYASICSAAVFAIICGYAYTSVDGMEWGYALAFVSFFLAITGVAVAVLFFHRARVMDSILKGTGLLAHWVYSAEEARESAKREYAEYQERNRALFLIIGGMLVIVALFFIIFLGEGGLITGVFLLAFTVFLFIISRVVPVLVRNQALKAPREAYIAEIGIIYEGAVYPYHSFLLRMDGVTYRKGSSGKPSVLVFSFIQLIGIILSPFTVVIPVPADEEGKAQEITRLLGNG
jgi:hypothetical protein